MNRNESNFMNLIVKSINFLVWSGWSFFQFFPNFVLGWILPGRFLTAGNTPPYQVQPVQCLYHSRRLPNSTTPARTRIRFHMSVTITVTMVPPQNCRNICEVSGHQRWTTMISRMMSPRARPRRVVSSRNGWPTSRNPTTHIFFHEWVSRPKNSPNLALVLSISYFTNNHFKLSQSSYNTGTQNTPQKNEQSNLTFS